MTIDKIDNVWANSGDCEDFSTTDPAGTKQDTGYVGGDQPEIERFNELFRRQEQRINDIVQERINTFYDGSTNYRKQITTGIWDDSWAHMKDSANTITDICADICVYFPSTTEIETRLLTLATDKKIYVYDTRDLSLLDTSHDLTTDLPSGSGQTWVPQSMCTDGTHIFCTFRDTVTNKNQINSWLIEDWTENTGWTPGGTQLSGTNSWTALIIADDDFLAIADESITISAASSAAIVLIDRSDGTIDSSGAGDAPTGLSLTAQKLCSDGTNIYFIADDSGTNTVLCSATITNVQVGCGGSNYPLTIGTGVQYAIVSCGDTIVSMITGAYNTNTVFVSDSSDADLDKLIGGQDSQGTPITVDNYFMCYPVNGCFDGINVWFISSIDRGGYPDDRYSLIKIDVASLHRYDPITVRQLIDVGVSYSIDVQPSGGANDTDRVIFDGRDIWTYTFGTIQRLPLALFRS